MSCDMAGGSDVKGADTVQSNQNCLVSPHIKIISTQLHAAVYFSELFPENVFLVYELGDPFCGPKASLGQAMY
jgi:hypothetical protein